MTRSCRFCGSLLERTLLDLGDMPLANAFPGSLEEASRERTYPLHARICDQCLLVQVDEVVTAEELFRDYAYFSSYSTSWVAHAAHFAALAIDHLQLGPESLVIEVASNDGYLLRHFAGAGVPVVGVEPAANVAAESIAAGIPTEVAFFGLATTEGLYARYGQADLLVANNVLAHAPNLNDFTAGLAVALKPKGVLTIEVPHLLNLIERVEFDTIYHEHFSYFSLLTVERVLRAHGLTVFDVEELPTHGGSLRIWATHRTTARKVSERLHELRRIEVAAGLNDIDRYAGFSSRVDLCRMSLRSFLTHAARNGKSVVAYGAAAKGNTLLNYCGVKSTDIPFVVDRNPTKQGRFLPGSHLPIHSPDHVSDYKPDYLLVLPWNLREEVIGQMKHIRSWGGSFVIPIPTVAVVP